MKFINPNPIDDEPKKKTFQVVHKNGKVDKIEATDVLQATVLAGKKFPGETLAVRSGAWTVEMGDQK